MKNVSLFGFLALFSLAYAEDPSPQEQQPATIQQIQKENQDDQGEEEAPDEDVIIMDEDNPDEDDNQ